MSLRDRTLGKKVPMFNARINQDINNGCNWNDGDILYSELETVLQCESPSAVAIYCFGPQRSAFISNLIDRTVIIVTQLGCPKFVDINFPTISCTFACHMSKHACALQSAYSIAQWMHFHIRSLLYTRCPLQHIYHKSFPDVDVTGTCILPEQAEDKIFQNLPGWDPPTIREAYKFFVRCGVESNTVVNSSDIQESYP